MRTGVINSGGIILGDPVLEYGTSTPLTVAQVQGQLVLTTAAITITLPAVVIGSIVTIYAKTAHAISVDPNVNDRIILDGAPGGDGKKITSASAAGDFVTLIGDSVAGWIVIGRSGTWTMEA
jgi:hypothetical protein